MLARYADHWQSEQTSNCLRNVFKMNALLTHCMKTVSWCHSVFEDKTIDRCGVVTVDGRPAVHSVTDVR